MRCPKCQSLKSSVIDSRQAEDGNTIRRRRSCDQCGQRFTTYERIEEKTLVVVKKDGTREQFHVKDFQWDYSFCSKAPCVNR